MYFSVSDWHAFLTRWSDDAIASRRQEPSEHLGPLSIEAMENGTCLFPPAEEPAIAASEARLGARFPESYKNFLRASNGFIVLGLDVEDALIRPVETICWLRDGEPGLVEAWGRGRSNISDELYLVYGPAQDCVHLRVEYFSSLLQVSDFVESAMLMLNPEILTSAGEWESWSFGNAKPGANRFRTFQEMMLHERDATLSNLANTLSFLAMMERRPPWPGRRT